METIFTSRLKPAYLRRKDGRNVVVIASLGALEGFDVRIIEISKQN